MSTSSTTFSQPGPSSPTPNHCSTNEERIALLEHKLDNVYIFEDKLLALQALQASGLPLWFRGQWKDVPNNKHLAMLGDNVLDHHLLLEWMETHTSREEYSTRRSLIASNRNLHRIGRRIGLDDCVIRPTDASQPIGVTSMATAVEAILGAVFLDANARQRGSGMDSVARVASELGLNFSEW